MIKYNETALQVQNTENYGILIQYCIDKRHLPVKTYCYHSIHLMSKRSLYKIFLLSF